MDIRHYQAVVAASGMIVGFTLMILGRRRSWPRELRVVGGFLSVAGFCYLLGIEIPRLFN